MVFGRGGSGKSTLCRRLGELTGLPVIELDRIYWNENLDVLSSEEWVRRQLNITEADQWIIDGDFGPLDVREPRLARADTVILMDTPLINCVWRAVRRSRQRMDFWVWVFQWGYRYRPAIIRDVQKFAPGANLVKLANRREIENWLTSHVTNR